MSSESEIAYSTTMLLGMAPMAHFKHDMFNVTNTRAMQHVFYFLFKKLNLHKSFQDIWPISDKKQNIEFVKITHSILKDMQDRNIIPNIIPIKSCLQTCQGRRFVSLWFYLSKYTLQIVLERDLSDYSKTATYKNLPPMSNETDHKLRPVYLNVLNRHIELERLSLLHNTNAQLECHQKWINLADTLGTEYRECCMELGRIDQESKIFHKTIDSSILSPQGSAQRTSYKTNINKAYRLLDSFTHPTETGKRNLVRNYLLKKESKFPDLANMDNLSNMLEEWNNQLNQVNKLCNGNNDKKSKEESNDNDNDSKVMGGPFLLLEKHVQMSHEMKARQDETFKSTNRMMHDLSIQLENIKKQCPELIEKIKQLNNKQQQQQINNNNNDFSILGSPDHVQKRCVEFPATPIIKHDITEFKTPSVYADAFSGRLNMNSP